MNDLMRMVIIMVLWMRQRKLMTSIIMRRVEEV